MYQKFFKRLFDIVGALVFLPFVLIEIIILAPVIWLTDRGPVFYNAYRVGKGYNPFKMFKLRSMYVNAPDLRKADGSTYNADDDPRVTPIGRLMRSTSLDELPQLLNVLLGHMSFIGPRPKAYSSKAKMELKLADLDETHRKSYMVKPGITGYAQAYYRNSISNEEKFQLDAYYAENVSFIMDVKILCKTVVSVLLRKDINQKQV